MGSNLYKLRSFGYAEIDDEIWFPNLNFNALMKINKLTGRLEIVDKFPNYGVWQGWLYSTVCHVNGQLVFVPSWSEEIVAYHIETQKFVSTPLDNKFIGEKKYYFGSAYVYKQYVYMFPTGAKCMVRYDAEKQTITYLENNVSALIRAIPETLSCFYQQFEVIDQKIYIPFLELNAVVIFDLKDESTEIKYLDIEGGCSTINYLNEYFYLTSFRSPKIYRWNDKTGKVQTYQSFPDEFKGEKLFIGACKTEDSLIFFPGRSNMIISFSVLSGKIHEVQRFSDPDCESVVTYFVQEDGTEYTMLTAEMDAISSFTYEENSLKLKPYCQRDKVYNKKQIDQFFMGEDKKDLEKYIVDILEHSGDVMRQKHKTNCGKRIFEQICKA